MVRIVELSAVQKSEVSKRIEERLNGKLGLNLKFSEGLQAFSSDLKAVELDLSLNESDGEVVGIQYNQNVLQNGEEVELQYTEVKDVWLYQLNKMESNNDVIEQEFEKFKESKDYHALLNFLKEGGYNLAPDSQKVLNVEQFSFDEESQKSTKNFIRALTVDIKEKNEIVGLLVFSDNILIKFNDDEDVVVFNEDTPVIVPLDTKGRWKRCMADCIGCGTWQACVGTYSCLATCARCNHPLTCGFCLACAVANSTCLWRCRLCVAGAGDRIKECPVK